MSPKVGQMLTFSVTVGLNTAFVSLVVAAVAVLDFLKLGQGFRETSVYSVSMKPRQIAAGQRPVKH